VHGGAIDSRQLFAALQSQPRTHRNIAKRILAISFSKAGCSSRSSDRAIQISPLAGAGQMNASTIQQAEEEKGEMC